MWVYLYWMPSLLEPMSTSSPWLCFQKLGFRHHQSSLFFEKHYEHQHSNAAPCSFVLFEKYTGGTSTSLLTLQVSLYDCSIVLLFQMVAICAIWKGRPDGSIPTTAEWNLFAQAKSAVTIWLARLSSTSTHRHSSVTVEATITVVPLDQELWQESKCHQMDYVFATTGCVII